MPSISHLDKLMFYIYLDTCYLVPFFVWERRVMVVSRTVPILSVLMCVIGYLKMYNVFSRQIVFLNQCLRMRVSPSSSRKMPLLPNVRQSSISNNSDLKVLVCVQVLKAKSYPNGSLEGTVFAGNSSSTWHAIHHGVKLLKRGLVWHVGCGGRSADSYLAGSLAPASSAYPTGLSGHRGHADYTKWLSC